MQNPLAEYSPEMELFEQENQEWTHESHGETLNEALEMELAAELLEVRDEYELDQFLGKLIKSAARGIGKAVQSPTFRALGGVLKGIAKKALPIAGGALGTFVGGPLGGTIGSKLASMAGSALGLELEGLSQEDREFEAARQFVRFAGDAVRNTTSSGNADPVSAARAATAMAARRYAPGLLNGARNQVPFEHRRSSGRWIRRGGNIVILNS